MPKGIVVLIIGLILLLGITTFSFAQGLDNSEQLTITTYYPSPYGVYKNLRLFPDPVIAGDVCDGAVQGGTLAYSGTQNVPLYCDGSNSRWQFIGGLGNYALGDFTKSNDFDFKSRTGWVNLDWKQMSGWTASSLDTDSISALNANAMRVNMSGIAASILVVSWNVEAHVDAATKDQYVKFRLYTRRYIQGNSTPGGWTLVAVTDELQDGYYDEEGLFHPDGKNGTYTVHNAGGTVMFAPGRTEAWREFLITATKVGDLYGVDANLVAYIEADGTSIHVAK